MSYGIQPYQHVAKKYVYDILQERYAQNEPILTRLTHYLTTEQDVRDFVKLFVDAYEGGYLKAVNDYRGKLKDMGYDVQITADHSKEG